MLKFFDSFFLDNTIKSYLLVFSVILFVILLKRFISRYLAGLLFTLIKRVWKNIDKKSFTGLIVRPLGLFLVIFILPPFFFPLVVDLSKALDFLLVLLFLLFLLFLPFGNTFFLFFFIGLLDLPLKLSLLETSFLLLL